MPPTLPPLDAAPLPPVPAASNLKQASLFYVSATHWLTAAFAIPIVGGILAGILIAILTSAVGVPLVASSLPAKILFTLVGFALTWYGALYSSRFIAKRYQVADPLAVAKKATVIAVVIGVVFRALALAGSRAAGTFASATFAVETVSFVATIAVFYFASVKYLKKNV